MESGGNNDPLSLRISIGTHETSTTTAPPARPSDGQRCSKSLTVKVVHTELNLTVQLGLRVLILGTLKLRLAHHLGQSLAKGSTELRGTML